MCPLFELPPPYFMNVICNELWPRKDGGCRVLFGKVMNAKLRAISSKDIPALAEIYHDAIMHLGQEAYNEGQLSVWASFANDRRAFARTLSAGVTLCAEVAGRPVAFGQLNPRNHIALLYCHSVHAKKGYASLILGQLERIACQEGIVTIDVKASIVARPFFEHHGYSVIEEEVVSRAGVALTRYHMEKKILD